MAQCFGDVFARKQHPLYQTSNNSYGARKPSQSELPQQWNGVRGEFTKKNPGAIRDNGFVVAITKSKVHSTLDGF